MRNLEFLVVSGHQEDGLKIRRIGLHERLERTLNAPHQQPMFGDLQPAGVFEQETARGRPALD